MRALRISFIALLFACLAACATTTSIGASDQGTSLQLRGTKLDLPARHSLKGTSFGNYEFKAEAPGHEPFYGLLPLNFKGSHLALDVLFFAPGAFFNLRGAFPYYQIDVANQVVRFKKKDTDEWTEIHPKSPEIERARAYFGDHQ
jgi:hypothetical protein